MLVSFARASRRAALASSRTASTSSMGSMGPIARGGACVCATPSWVMGAPARAGARPGIAHARSTSTSSSSSSNKNKKQASETSDAVQQRDERSGRYDEITDKWIPEKPVSVIEGASYGVVGLLGLGVAAAAVWFGANELLVTPREQKVFNAAMTKLEDDPRIRISLGAPLTGYGSESRSRSARHRIAHQIVIDGRGRERVRVQFYARGARGSATVHAEAGTNAETGELEFSYIIADVAGAHGTRIQVVSPQQQPQRLVAL